MGTLSERVLEVDEYIRRTRYVASAVAGLIKSTVGQLGREESHEERK